MAEGICRGLRLGSRRLQQLSLFIFRHDGTTCQVHMRYVVA
jgi:hypothetical protein